MFYYGRFYGIPSVPPIKDKIETCKQTGIWNILKDSREHFDICHISYLGLRRRCIIYKIFLPLPFPAPDTL